MARQKVPKHKKSLNERVDTLEHHLYIVSLVAIGIALFSAIAAIASAIIQKEMLDLVEPRYEYEMLKKELLIRKIGGQKRDSERISLELVRCSGSVEPEPVDQIWSVAHTFVSGRVVTYYTKNLSAIMSPTCPSGTSQKSLVFIHNNNTIKIKWPTGLGTIIEPYP